MYPVAFDFFEGESTDSWRWFLLQLCKAIGEPSPLVIHCDASKGLIAVVRDVFPQAEMRECFRHLMQNYMKQFSGKEHMYSVARACRCEVHEQHKANVVRIDGFVQWMKVNHPLLWYQSGFKMDIKCDYITNNITEVFNNWVKDHKDIPICELADKTRVKIMELFFKRRRIRHKLEGKILPSVINILNACTRGLGHLSPAKSDYYSAEVQDNNNVLANHIVKAAEKWCSCLEWQHTGKSYQHGLVVIIAQPSWDVGMENFVDDYFSVENFKKAYVREVQPITDRSFWPDVEITAYVGAPLLKRPDGRQRKNRLKGCLEDGSDKKTEKNESEKAKKLIRGQFKCLNCYQLGHRKASPKCSLNGTKKRQVTPFPFILCL
jgi:hypothetical protein